MDLIRKAERAVSVALRRSLRSRMASRESVDVVVVGAGAGGCVVAARLAETSSRSVLLLEAGPDLRAMPTTEMRDGWGYPKDHHWGLKSEPDRNGVVAPLRRCKLVGGTSWVTRFAVRGSPADFNEWADLGNPGWGFDDVLPYFRKIESDLDFGHKPWHGNSGPIPVNRYRDLSFTETGQAAIEAMTAVGFPTIEDHNEPGAVGVGKMPMSSRDGRRVSAADAYLPIATSSNLRIRPDTQVSKVVFEGTTARSRTRRRDIDQCGLGRARRGSVWKPFDADALGDRTFSAPEHPRHSDPG